MLILTLVLSTGLPFFALAKMPDIKADAYQMLYGEKMLICTSGGFKIANTADVFDEQHAEEHQCQLCYFNNASQPFASNAPQIVTAIYSSVLVKNLSFAGQARQNQLYVFGLNNRAPPFFC